MWYDATRTGIEALKAALSVAVLWGGMLVSGVADRSIEEIGSGVAGDVVGIWTWVADASLRPSGAAAPEAGLLEIRRSADGMLTGRLLARSGGEPVIEDVSRLSFSDGRLCLELGSGTAFKGTLRADGRAIDGTMQLDGSSASALLRKVETRKRSREAPALRAT